MKSVKGRDLLGQWMKKKGFNQAEAARQVGVSRQIFNKWLLGRARPSGPSASLLESRTGITRDKWE